LRLAREGVPLAVDYRDGWSLDVLGGGEAFAPNSRAGRIEAEVIRLAQSVWVVNQPIADWYAKRYPDLGDRLSVVRNGFDPVAVPTTTRRPDPAAGLTFAYVGTVNFMPALTQALLEGWTLARASDVVMARSSLVFRGHMGAGHGRGANAHARMVDQTAGVTYGGPVRKADLAGIYSGVDALVLALAGGRYVTSGKVYEYGATGLPILSVHEAEHDAHAVLADYPLHAVAASLDAEGVRDGFLAARNLALQATDADRQQARAVGARFERRRQLEPAVAALAERFER
jgi:hypothetical protein